MSYTPTTKSQEVSDTDSEGNYPLRKHPYNTRFSKINYSLQNLNPKKRLKKSDPDSKYSKKKNPNLLEDNSSMDYCFDSRPSSARKPESPSFFCSLLLKLFYLSLLGGVGFAVYSHYLMYKNFAILKEEVEQIKETNKKVEKVITGTDSKPGETLDFFPNQLIDRPDFALQSSGARIFSVDAIPFSNPKKFLGFTLCEGEHGPSSMIQATTSPGECWAFKGHSGKAIIQLIHDVIIDSVTLEHISKTISPTGTIETAPKDFRIWGIKESQNHKQLLGEFKYEKDGPTIQNFPIQNDSIYYRYVEFEVMSNHGSHDFTCVYRLRVHGKPIKF